MDPIKAVLMPLVNYTIGLAGCVSARLFILFTRYGKPTEEEMEAVRKKQEQDQKQSGSKNRRKDS